jgi:hypothetical protein
MLMFAMPASALASGGGGTNGVHVDPGSPAGKQYSIPVSTARSQASGYASGSNAGSPPLFGVGVTPGGTAGNSTHQAAGAGSSGSGTHTHVVAGGKMHRVFTRRQQRSSGTPKASATSTTPGAESNSVGGGGWLPLAAGGLMVLVIGCGGGLLLRRHAG